jgi:hypothetical protein
MVQIRSTDWVQQIWKVAIFGGFLAIVGGFFTLLDEESPGWGFNKIDPSLGFYFSILGGFIGILCGAALFYAYSQERGISVSKYQPQPVESPTTGIQVGVQSQQEKPMFCKNCGTKIVGEFCQECDTKAEF